jgi:nicotinate-nucleotide adenylyltransferase
MKISKRRIGIYSGAFDPVHAGHVAFALQAMQQAGLDKLYFLPERRPRHKAGVEHFGHRVAMLNRAIRPYDHFAVLELPDVSFSIEYTLPRLQRQFADCQLVWLFGSDAASCLHEWPLAERLLQRGELIIGLRSKTDRAVLEHTMATWPTQPLALTIVASYAPTVSSSKIRAGLRQGRHVAGLLSSVVRYSNQHWLYVSLNRIIDTP